MTRLILLLTWTMFGLARQLHGEHFGNNGFDSFIERQLVAYRVPGLAVGIIKDKDVILKRGYGVTNLDDPAPVTAQTIFPILSCTKAFTSAAIGMLVDEGKLRWDDKVIKFLPDFTLSDPWITRELTITDVLSHRSGLGEFDGDLLWYGTSYSPMEILERIKHYPIKKDFRAEYSYQNVMYLVAGMVTEAVSGTSWQKFIHERCFTPLEMSNSSTSTADLQLGTFAHPHLNSKCIPIVSLDNIAPAGAVNSSIEEILHWLELWLGRGTWRGKKLLSQKTFQTMTTPKMMTSAHSFDAYGLGWQLSNDGGRRTISHGGGLPGFKSQITILPDDGIGVVIFANSVSYLVDELAGVVLESLLNPNDTDWKTADSKLQFDTFTFSWENRHQPPEAQKADIQNGMIGLYEDAVYGRARISENEGKAFLELLPSKNLLSGFLYELQKDKYSIVFNDPFLSPGKVVFDTEGEETFRGFRIDLPSGDFHFEYLDFRRLEIANSESAATAERIIKSNTSFPNCDD